MALDRWIALVFIIFCCIYGYLAFFTMDDLLPPIMRNKPVWPSTFPKVLSIAGALLGLVVLLGLEGKGEDKDPAATDIDYRRLTDYHLTEALLLLGLMVLYAISLRSAGFLPATILFILAGSFILGERNWLAMVLSAVLVGYLIWLLVQVVLDIYLGPLPAVFAEENRAFIEAHKAGWEWLVALFETAEEADQ